MAIPLLQLRHVRNFRVRLVDSVLMVVAVLLVSLWRTSSDLHKHGDLRDIKRSQGFLFYYFYFVFFTHSHKRNIYSLPVFLIDFLAEKNGKVHIEFTFLV